MAIINKNLISTTPAMYLFRLYNRVTDTSLVLKSGEEPIEWSDGEIELNRINLGGIFSSFSVGSLTFRGNGAKFIKDIFDAKEVNGECELYIYYFNKYTRQYIQFPNIFALNFNTYKIVKIGSRPAIGVNIAAINSSFHTKLENRRKTIVDVTKKKSIGGFEVLDYAGLKKAVAFPAIEIDQVSSWIEYAEAQDFFSQSFTGFEADTSYLCIQQQIDKADIPGSVSVTDQTSLLALSSMYIFSLIRNTAAGITFTLNSDFGLTFEADGTGTWSVAFQVVRVIFDSSDIVKSETAIASEESAYSYVVNNAAPESHTAQYSDEQEIALLAGESVGYFVKITYTTGTTDIIVTYNSVGTTAVRNVVSTDATTLQGMPGYETLERFLQLIMDTQYPLYSQFFGRTDVVWNTDNDTYETENQERLFSVFSGLNLRGKSLTATDGGIPLTFDNLMDQLRCLYGVDYAIEIIGGQPRVRIEPLSYFYDNSVVLDLSSRLSKYDVETEIMPEYIFNEIQSGYKSFDYETIGGRGEYNGLNTRTTVANTDSKFDNVAPYRCDTRGIVKQILKGQDLESDSEDTKNDETIFFVKTQVGDTTNWKAEDQENMLILDNSSIYKTGNLNLFYTPTWNLIRNSERISPGLVPFQSSPLQFQTASKSSTLKTQYGSVIISENEDITYSNLNTPFFRPIMYTCEVDFTFDDLTVLMTNTKGKIKLAEGIEGYLLNLKKKNAENKAEIQIIKAYEEE